MSNMPKFSTVFVIPLHWSDKDTQIIASVKIMQHVLNLHLDGFLPVKLPFLLETFIET